MNTPSQFGRIVLGFSRGIFRAMMTPLSEKVYSGISFDDYFYVYGLGYGVMLIHYPAGFVVNLVYLAFGEYVDTTYFSNESYDGAEFAGRMARY